MSKSVKLSNGDYIDAGAVWDNTQGSDAESIISTLEQASIKYIGQMKTANTDIYEYAKTRTSFWALIISSSVSHSLTHWIGDTDGMLLRIGFLMFATDGWNNKLYVNVGWGSLGNPTWKGWTLIA